MNSKSALSTLWIVAVVFGLFGCSKAEDGNQMMQPVGAAGTGAFPMAGTGAQPAAGTGAAPVAGSGAPTAGSGAPPTAGSGAAGAAGTDGAAGMAGTDGAAGTDGTAGTGVSGPDNSNFIADCQQGGASWGTEAQTGPCSSTITVYGVNIPFGPYGASSEYNVGQGFENTVSASDNAMGCSSFIDSFGADPVGSADLKQIHDLDLALYTVFYPGDMPEGEKFPLITWGNGTCAMPEGYGPLLRYVASHGYIVVAANSRYVGSGAAQRKAIDFMFAENDKADSRYYQRIDTDNVGAMGHSQGGMGTAAAAADARIKSVILWNGGSSASKPFFAISSDRDLFTSVAAYMNSVNAAPRPAAFLFYHQIPVAVDGSSTGALAPGHLTLMMEPERVVEPTVAWWNMMLKGDASAKAMFIGDSCTLCDSNAYPSMWGPNYVQASTTAHDYGKNAMLE